MTPRAPLVLSATAEVLIHTAVLLLVLTPLFVVIFPIMMTSVAIIMISNALGSSSAPEGAPLLLAAAPVLVLAGLAFIAAWRRPASALKLRDLVGQDGERLRTVVAQIWATVVERPMPAPDMRWFPALDIAAYAGSRDGRPEVQISAGLWRAAVRGEPIATAILAHEVAHLIYRDPLLLQVLRAALAAGRAALAIVGALGLATVGAVMLHEVGRLVETGAGAAAMLGRAAIVLGASATVLVIVPLSWLTLRRQAAFISSLIEVRADLGGAALTGGLQAFTQAFASRAEVVHTGRHELVRALLSPRLTHIPERERLALLAAPAMIVTPKLQFFAFSLTLGLLLPLNFASGYVFGGAANHLVMTALAAALNASVAAMLVLGQSGGTVAIPLRRLVFVSAIVVLATALPRFNLEPVSYLAMSWLAGFGGSAANLSTLAGDLQITFDDLANKFRDAFLLPGVLASMLVTFVALQALCATSRIQSSAPVARACLAAIVAAASTIAVADDGWRAAVPTRAMLDGYIGPGAHAYAFLLCLPLLAALVADVVWLMVGAAIGRRGP